MRLGIFGGSFDPPHVGHYLAAIDACETLALDRLLWVPASVQPHKAGSPHRATAAQRLEMVRLAIQSDPRFVADGTEIDRGGLSYTVDTLTALGERFPGAERFLLVGEDAWASFGMWRNPDQIRALATIAVLRRGPSAPALEGKGVVLLPTRRVDVSSTEIRRRVREGQPVFGFVADAVARYIESAGLYEAPAQESKC